MSELKRYHTIRNITVLTAVVNALLATLKLFFGWIAHSHALFADGVHSLADLFSDVIVVTAAKYGSMTRDQDHPYGHGKIETLGTAILSLLLSAVGVGIAIDAFEALLHPAHEIPGLVVLFVAIISIIANEILFQVTRLVANRINSDLLIANAWHHRSDALSSIVVLLGALGSLMGWFYFDAIAAIVVALMILQMAWTLVWQCLRELIDTAIDDVTLTKIKAIIKQVPGVEQLHECRTRTMRGHIIVDVHVIVGSYLSVSEGHHIAQQVHQNLRQAMQEIIDVTVHIDPEDDELFPPSIDLPSRTELLDVLKPLIQDCPGYTDMKMTLHYLAGKLEITFSLPRRLLQESDHDTLLNAYQDAQKAHPDIAKIQLIYY